MSVRALSTVIVIGAAALGLAACAQPGTAVAAGPGASAPATAAPASPAAPSTAPVSTAPSHAAPSTAAAGDHCPVDGATLLTALKNSPDVNRFLAPTKTLTGIVCYRGYALAGTQPKDINGVRVVYQYTSGSWHAVVAGSGEYCDSVPTEVRKHLSC
jgi:hypothetical protein